MRLFCFPYAGGSAHAYRGLQARLAPRIEAEVYELPGHGRRGGEELRTSLAALADDAFERLGSRLRDDDYALFGHSMGAALAYELARRVLRERLPPPRHLFVSGRQSPSIPGKQRRWMLPSPQFRAMLRELGGVPPEVAENDELMELLEPVVRADFQAIETYVAPAALPLPLPVTVFVGERDEVLLDDARAWQNQTVFDLALHRLPGNHFFLFEQWPRIAEVMLDALG
ncbi:MAG TPA: alpha/beta fold hydrolase [Thermoanaerobaculia bacterium]